MRSFVILALVAVAVAAPQGYNYQQPAQQISHGASSNQHGSIAGLGHVGGSIGGVAGGHHQVQQQQHQTIVSKHFYIHAAPEETAEEAHSQQLSAGPGHKHYQVVFIKAPSQSASSAAISLAQAQNEEKTVIYVLSRKTDAAELQTHFAEAKNAASKPEVYFIKYKTQAEAQHAQQQIQAQYDALGGTSQVTDEGVAPVQNFIGALGGSAGGSHGQGSVGHGGSVSHGIGGGVSQGIGGGVSSSYLPPRF